MGLPWVRFDTSFPQHDKVVELASVRGGREAGFVYVCGLAYCGQHETDGVVPFGALPFVHGRKKDAELLVAHGLWRPHPRGWEVVNYLERQPSAATLEQSRADRSTAGRKANCARWHKPGCTCWRVEEDTDRNHRGRVPYVRLASD
jgi:hypothetical protein